MIVETMRSQTIGQRQDSRQVRSASSRFWRYGPLVVWAILIFIGSGDLLAASHTSWFLLEPFRWLFPNTSESTLEAIHFLVRKAGHFTEYAVLAAFAAHAFRTSSHALLRRRWFWIAFALVAVYALSDEFHQSFIQSRTASIYDSMIDSIGGLTALAFRGLLANRRFN